MTPERGEFDVPHWSSVEASSEEVGVATARFVKTGVTPDEYDQMREKLGVGDTPPAGGVFHAAAVGEDGKIRVFEVWDSPEQAEAWGDKVMASHGGGLRRRAARDRIPRCPQRDSALVGSRNTGASDSGRSRRFGSGFCECLRHTDPRQGKSLPNGLREAA